MLCAGVIAIVAAGCQPTHLRDAAATFDAPDPHIVRTADGYALYSTESGGRNIPVRTSTDLDQWSDPVDALPDLPDWALGKFTWAPSVEHVGGQYVMWFASAGPDAKHCMDRAVSPSPTGPFTPVPGGPVYCAYLGGWSSIDPYLVSVGSTRYLYWAEGITPTRIMGVRLTWDGLRPIGTPRELLRAALPWEASTIENPAMIRRDDTFELFYSANGWQSSRYATGHARCSGPLGPCTRTTTDAPFLRSMNGVNGPGGLSFFVTERGERWAVYHAWGSTIGYPDGGRRRPHLEPFVWVFETEPLFTNRAPAGRFDTVRREQNGIRVTGWTYDPDNPGPNDVVVYSTDGVAWMRTAADHPRPELHRVLDDVTGDRHGFDDLLVGPASMQRVCMATVDDLDDTITEVECRNVP